MTIQGTRVLLILNSLCAEGTPVLALDLCRRWSARGIRPLVVTLAATPQDLASEFQQAQIPVRSLGLSNSGYVRYARMVAAVQRVCRETRPRAVLSMPFGWHAFLATGARLAGVPTVAVHVGNYPSDRPSASLSKFRALVQLGRPVTSSLICCSSYVQRGVLERFRVDPGETRVIYNGVDVDAIEQRVAAARMLGRTSADFVVAMVGRLEVHKDQPTLIRAAKLVRDAGRSLKVWLIGEGCRRAEYEQLIRELGLGDVVELLGMRRDVPELLARADLFVFAATPDEGQGVALVEAMVSGVPVLATHVGACSEVLEDGRLGLLVPPGRPGEMADAIVRAMSERDRSAQRVALARAKARSTFSIDAMAAAYADSLGIG